MSKKKIKCKICGKELEWINSSHLRKHGISQEEYKRRFPHAPIIKDEISNKLSKNAKKRQKSNSNFGFDRGKSNPGHNKSEKHLKNLKNSINRGFKNGREVWNKGETKETNENVKKYSESIEEYERTEEHRENLLEALKSKERRKKISKAMKGREFTDEWRKKISKSKEGMKIWDGSRPEAKKWMKGEKNPQYGKVNYPKPYFIEELGHKVRSSWEAKIGKILQNSDVDYDYEGKTFEFNRTTYTPDFSINNSDIFVEVKGYFPKRQKNKYRDFRDIFSDISFIIVGGDSNNPQDVCDEHIFWDNRVTLPRVVKKHF